ncbi:putative acyl carrier protein [Spiroplasma litorale]|uniref:Putative acyl carrier protein n=1 Tax=Spiroplasma litorale TaxID=216942 RepID=A0A0K1W0V3_9MOLU|nr:phosphopantetheine-binding protein [Spiroplasma litorale]AKX33806.1 putative acyl carrier protein [Spiroplasma litorale]
MNYFEEIKKALIKKGAKGSITKESAFKDMELDSLDLMDMIVSLENKLEITVPDDDLVTIKTVDDILKVIEKLKNES